MVGFAFTQNPMVVVRDDGVDFRVDSPLYREWLSAGGIPTPYDTKAPVLSEARELRDKIFLRLDGIQLTYIVAGDNNAVSAIEAAKQGLREITTYATVAAAVTGADATLAIRARYAELVAGLAEGAPYAVTAFNGMDA